MDVNLNESDTQDSQNPSIMLPTDPPEHSFNSSDDEDFKYLNPLNSKENGSHSDSSSQTVNTKYQNNGIFTVRRSTRKKRPPGKW